MRNETAINQNKSQKALKITKWVIYGICLALIAFLLVVVCVLAWDKYVNKSPAPSFCGYSTLIIATGSMSGTLEEGDIVIIKQKDDYQLSEIVTFIHEGETVPTTHRIIQYGSDGNFITKGDANDSADKLTVSNDEILGEVVCSLPALGIFVGWFTEGSGWIFVVLALLIIVLGVYILKWEKNVKAKE